jgi:cytochrome c-type biogenesis protein CcmH/NrfF
VPVWLLWLLPVLVAPLLGVAWTSWTGRTRGPVEVADSVEQYERFRAALAAPVPPRRRSSSG